jgi:superfamily I DNA/RNA helicase
MTNITKVFGPPGSGKTTFLLSIVEQELESGVHPMKIGYFAFTKKAATEARDRAIQKFPRSTLRRTSRSSARCTAWPTGAWPSAPRI